MAHKWRAIHKMAGKWRAKGGQMVNTGSIPLDFTPDVPNEETRKAIAEGDAFFKSGKAGRFISGADLIKDAVSR